MPRAQSGLQPNLRRRRPGKRSGFSRHTGPRYTAWPTRSRGPGRGPRGSPARPPVPTAQASASPTGRYRTCSPPTSRSTGRSRGDHRDAARERLEHRQPEPLVRARAAPARPRRRRAARSRVVAHGSPVRTTSRPAPAVSSSGPQPAGPTSTSRRGGPGGQPAQGVEQRGQDLAGLDGADEQDVRRRQAAPAAGSLGPAASAANQPSSTPSGVTATRPGVHAELAERLVPARSRDGVQRTAASRTPRGTRSR